MTTESIRITATILAAPQRIYDAWLDGKSHSAFTGGKATIEPGIGGRHTAWDGYIEGVTLQLVPGKRIVQSWHTSEFPADAIDSRLDILLEEVSGGTKLTLVHSEIPAGQGAKYKSGWQEHYFAPMKKYFAAKAVKKKAAPKKKSAVRGKAAAAKKRRK